jgi:hypothetical protein
MLLAVPFLESYETFGCEYLQESGDGGVCGAWLVVFSHHIVDIAHASAIPQDAHHLHLGPGQCCELHAFLF